MDFDICKSGGMFLQMPHAAFSGADGRARSPRGMVLPGRGDGVFSREKAACRIVRQGNFVVVKCVVKVSVRSHSGPSDGAVRAGDRRPVKRPENE